MKLAATIICLFCTILLSSCSVNNFDIGRYKRKFDMHKEEFEILVNLLNTQNIKIGYSINENSLSDSIQIFFLRNLDISDVNLTFTKCDGILEYQFTSTWSSKSNLYFSKDNCDKQNTLRDFHDKPSEMIEVWGMGDGWVMWIDHDFI